jgi:phage terminase small subunit
MSNYSQNPNQKLTGKQREFCLEWVKTRDTTKAALKAGYSPKTAQNIGYQLIRLPNIRKEIMAIEGPIQVALQEKVGIDREWLIKEVLLPILGADMGEYAKWGPGGVILEDSSALDSSRTRAVEEVSQHVGAAGGGSIRFKLHSKLDAAKQIATLMGLNLEAGAAEQAANRGVAAAMKVLLSLSVADLEAVKEKLEGE